MEQQNFLDSVFRAMSLLSIVNSRVYRKELDAIKKEFPDIFTTLAIVSYLYVTDFTLGPKISFF